MLPKTKTRKTVLYYLNLYTSCKEDFKEIPEMERSNDFLIEFYSALNEELNKNDNLMLFLRKHNLWNEYYEFLDKQKA